MYLKKGMICFICMAAILFQNSFQTYASGNTINHPVIIALDPGHGGEEDGAEYFGLKEKDINLQMAELVREELEEYPGVQVVLTRDSDETVSLSQRAERAREQQADILISLHFNASERHTSNGASVYISTGAQKMESLRQLADCLLGEFEAIGLENAGTFARVTQMGGRRADGSFEDYYGVLRHAYNSGIPAIIIEHCYMDSDIDRSYFGTKNGRKMLAKADAAGIAAYYGWSRADGTKAEVKHAQIYGATTKGVELDCFEAPQIQGIRLIRYDGATPGVALFEVKVEDAVGINSMYLVYQNTENKKTAVVSFDLKESLLNGTHQLLANIPRHLILGSYQLLYVGASNEAGYDAAYNYADGIMVGFGKCDWLNTFVYEGEADLRLEQAVADYKPDFGRLKHIVLYRKRVWP